jgi:hypothetical protein
MKKINTINIPFYEFNSSRELAEEVLADVKTKNFRLDAPEQGNILNDYHHEKLFDFFESAVKSVKNLYYKDTLEFPIVECWVNEYKTMTRLQKHYHSNSVICGLYYLTEHDKNYSTIFNAKNPWTHSVPTESFTHLNIVKDNIPLSGETIPEVGKLILFPASLIHYMNTISPKDKVLRYTIAFNTFADGVVSDSSTTKLHLKSVSLKEKLGINL